MAKKSIEGWLFNRIEKFGDQNYAHVGCEGETEVFGDFLTQFVPELGMRKKVRFTVEPLEDKKDD